MSVPVMRMMKWAEMPTDARQSLLHRGLDDIFDPALRTGVSRIIDDVRANGDEAVCRALRDFDGVTLNPSQLRITDDEFDQADLAVGAGLRAAIVEMIDHIRRFNDQVMARKGADWSFESSPGLTVGEKITPIASAGLFCPSGKASYPSVLAQLGGPAVVARVPHIVVITPPMPGSPTGDVDPAALVVASLLGLRNAFRVNGPAGIAAVAFGTETIPKVVKVMGPGSPAVTCAQIEVQRYGCSTMMLLGPTESMIIADDSADPIRLAADLLIEAEHGTDSTVVLVSLSESVARAVEVELGIQLAALPNRRAEAARSSLGVNGGCVLVQSMGEACEVANAFGAEHLQLAVAAPADALAALHCAGEILIGQHTPFSAANFVIGCPASLPTSGFASVSSGITAEAFLKRTAVAEATEEALRRLAPSVVALADHEGFPAHGNAIRLRFPS